MNVEEHAARFRRRLKTMREQAGMSRYALAKKIGCDQSTLRIAIVLGYTTKNIER